MKEFQMWYVLYFYKYQSFFFFACFDRVGKCIHGKFNLKTTPCFVFLYGIYLCLMYYIIILSIFCVYPLGSKLKEHRNFFFFRERERERKRKKHQLVAFQACPGRELSPQSRYLP